MKQFNRPFSLISASAIFMITLLATSANADYVIVDESVGCNTEVRFQPHFKIDRELGRAWVEVDLRNYIGEFHTLRAQVPALSFEKESNQVVLDVDGQQVVCAKGEGSTWSRSLGDDIVATGNCPFKISYEMRTVDDGYRPKQLRFLHVEMTVR